MDGFSFVDIFATKGIEYLVVIAYLALFVFFVRALSSGDVKSGKTAGKE
jgi:hypothetical protein